MPLEEKPDEQLTEKPDTPASTTSSSQEGLDGRASKEESEAREENQFDASSFEANYGMPPGSLGEAKDQESALAIIREHADRLLSAGLTAPSSPPPASGQQAKPKEGEGAAKSAAGSNPEIDALRAELQEVKSVIQKNEEAQFTKMFRELDSRIEKEIDSWESARYGKGKSRNYNQLRAVKELRDQVTTYINGHVATGQQTPVIESVLRQVRAFHDTDPSKPAPTGAKQAPLGTPGAARAKDGGGDQPPNIHAALMGR